MNIDPETRPLSNSDARSDKHNYCERTRAIASLKTSASAGPASAQIATTSPAVIKTIRTQPGTSPRSGFLLQTTANRARKNSRNQDMFSPQLDGILRQMGMGL